MRTTSEDFFGAFDLFTVDLTPDARTVLGAGTGLRESSSRRPSILLEGLAFTGFAAAIFCRGVCAAILFFARRFDWPKSSSRPGLFRFGFCVLYLIRVLIDA